MSMTRLHAPPPAARPAQACDVPAATPGGGGAAGRPCDGGKPQLLVAAHFVHAGRVGGAEQMLYNLVRGMAARRARATVLCGSADRLAPDFVAEVRRAPGLALRETGGTGSRFLAEQVACLDPSLRAEAVLFPNYYLPPVVPARLGLTGVVLHDLQYRHFPAYFSRRKRGWLRAAQAFALRRADRVFVISEFVRRDLLRLHGDRLADRLVVAPNPISWERFGAAVAGPPIEQPYILTVAAQYPHKNLPTLIRGFAELARRDRDIRLVLCGQEQAGLHGVGGTRVALRPLVSALGLEGRVHLTGYLDDVALGRWYRHAALFAFPSVFEGFGMPPVEALGLGLPVLAARRTALPEVTLGLAEFVEEAEEPQAWATHMEAMLRHGRRPASIDVARVREAYAPERCAARYLDAFGLTAP